MGELFILELPSTFKEPLPADFPFFAKQFHHSGVCTSRGFLEVFFYRDPWEGRKIFIKGG